MSDLEKAIQDCMRHSLESAFETKPDSDPRRYPGGIKGWIDTAVEMRMCEIRQWLHDPADVRKHLEELEYKS